MICRRLAELPQVVAVSIVLFTVEGAAVPLAMKGEAGSHARVGSPLPRPVAERLRSGALGGPWSERVEDTTQGGTIPALHRAGPSSETAVAPLQAGGELLGVLAVTGAAAGQHLPGRSLALAIDVAAVAATLVARAMDGQPGDDTLRRGIERIVELRAFRTVFQPIVSLGDLSVVGFEALTRFDDGANPESRFTVAGQVGLGVALEVAAIETAIAASTPLPTHCSLSLNVSGAALTADDRLSELLLDRKRSIVLELTEHDRIDDYPSVLRAVRSLGSDVHLSVDDAGAGYSCLAHVLALQPHYVKMDRGWIRGIESDPARQALVAGLRHFSRGTGCRLVAEGIETEDELSVLRDLDVELGQGFLLGVPEPAAP